MESFQAKRTIQNSDENQKAVATVKVTPTFVCNSVKINEIEVNASEDSEMPGTSTCDMPNEEKNSKKVTRNTSNGSKRKVRLRRMGSRQSSKTESSDTEDEQTASPDVRKVKRKTSRAKKQLESDKSIDNQDDEVVYVFKIKPGEKNEVTVKPVDVAKTEEAVLTASLETPAAPVTEPSSFFSDAIVKTKRKMFTPIEDQDGTVSTTISQEESPSTSDRNECDKLGQQMMLPTIDNEPHAKVSTLPPLPSPKVQRKFELTKQNSGKDLSPSIRLMIDRYNINIDKKSNSPNSSGSCSPIWRSPILDRRVRKQSEEYQFKILKSNSAQDVTESDKEKPEEIEATDNNKSQVNQTYDSSTETLIEPKMVAENQDAVPIHVEPNVIISSPETQHYSDTVTMRCDSNKPRTPLSERAMKIKQAKEAFLKMPIVSHDSSHSDWSYRLSQISVGSTDSNTSIMKCLSTGGILERNEENDDNTSAEIKSSSLPRNNTGLGTDSETISESSKGSRFGLSSLATKLRKVKLKRSKEVKKMNTVPVLCRQSIAVDFSSNNFEPTSRSESSQGVSRFRKNKHDNIKKSRSLGVLDNE